MGIALDDSVNAKPGAEILAGENGAGTALHFQTTGVHHDDAIAEHGSMIEIVESGDNRQFFAFHQAEKANLMLNVEVIRGFVHQQQLWLLSERAGNMQALFFAAGKGVPATMAKMLKIDFLQHGLDDIVIVVRPRIQQAQPRGSSQRDGL